MPNAIAEGSLVLTLDANKLNSGLKDAAAKAKKGSDDIAKELRRNSTEHIGNIFGGSSILASLGKGGAIGAGLAAIAFAGKETFEELVAQTRKWNLEMERSQRLNGLLTSSMNKRLSENVAAFDSLKDMANTDEGKAFRADIIKEIEAEADAAENALKNLKKQQEELNSKWNSGGNFQLFMGGGFEKEQKRVDDEVKALQERATQARTVANDVKKAWNQTENPEAFRQTQIEFAKLIASIRQAGQEAGLTDIQKQVLAIGRSLNLTNQQWDKFDATVRESELTKFLADSKERKNKIGMDEHDLRLYEFKKGNPSARDLGMAEAATQAERLKAAAKDANDWIVQMEKETNSLGSIIKRNADDDKLDELAKGGLAPEVGQKLRQVINLRKELEQTNHPVGVLQGNVLGTTQEAQARYQQTQRSLERENAERIIVNLQQLIAELKKLNITVGDIKVKEIPVF